MPRSKPAPGLHDHRLEPVASEDGLVGAELVEAFALGVPAPFAELEEGGGIPGVELTQLVERRRVEMDTDQGEQRAALAIPSPEHLVVPVGVFPADAFDRVDLAERADKPGFQPFASPIASSASRYFGLPEMPASATIPASPALCVQSVEECTEGCASCQSATRSMIERISAGAGRPFRESAAAIDNGMAKPRTAIPKMQRP